VVKKAPLTPFTGFNWSIPYIVGLAGLAWGIDDSLTIDEIYALLKETKTVSTTGNLIINPKAFIAAVIQKI